MSLAGIWSWSLPFGRTDPKSKPFGALIPEFRSHLNSESLFHFLFPGLRTRSKTTLFPETLPLAALFPEILDFC